MMVARRWVCAGVVAVLVAVLVQGIGAVLGAVQDTECESAYNYLSGCLTFVSGTDAVPNPDCCSGVTHLSTHDPHCLCTVIRELNDNPTVNFTKACALPLQCAAVVDSTECPTLVLPAGYSLPPSQPSQPASQPTSAASSPPTSAPWPLVAALAAFVTAHMRYITATNQSDESFCKLHLCHESGQ